MSEYSFPRVGIPMTEDQWGMLAQAYGSGILDMGGSPYRITAKDSVTDTITIGLDTYEGFNVAILKGFVHFMDTAITLSIPPVATETVYEVGLTYDSLRHSEESGPISLGVWTAPGDYSSGKDHIVLWRITRRPNVTLSNSTFEEVRQRVASVIVVSAVSHLPVVEKMLTDTMAFVRTTNEWYRAANNGTDPMSWIKVSQADAVTEEELNTRLNGYGNATAYETGGTIMARFPDGTARVKPPKEFWDVVNLGTLNSGLSGKANTGHSHSASDITTGTFSHARVTGSTSGYNTPTGSGASVFFDGSSSFKRFTSTQRHKINVRNWDKDPRELLKIEPKIYDRIDPQTGEVIGTDEVGVIAEQGNEYAPEFTEWGPDTLDEDNNPETETLIQGWTYIRWTVAQQHVLRWLTDRVDSQDTEIEELKAQLAAEKARNDDFEARLSKLEGNA